MERLLNPNQTLPGCSSPGNIAAGDAHQCLTTSMFVPSGAETSFGSGRNLFRGPGYFDMDAGLMKNFAITERFKFALGANFFNLLNHPHFATPENNLARRDCAIRTNLRHRANSHQHLRRFSKFGGDRAVGSDSRKDHVLTSSGLTKEGRSPRRSPSFFRVSGEDVRRRRVQRSASLVHVPTLRYESFSVTQKAGALAA